MRKPVTRQQARDIQAAKAAANVPGAVRRSIQREAIGSQQVDMSKYYYSRIRFQAEAGEDSLIFQAGKRYAFGYQLQREVDGHPGHNATYADTNLLEERSTNRGETVKILGMAIRPTPFTDSYIMNALDMWLSVVLRLDNDNVMFLGNPSDIPGSSQNAEGPSWFLPPPAEDTEVGEFQACKKGDQRMSNLLMFAEPIIWTPEGKDAKLDVMFELNQQVELTAFDPRNATDVTAAGAGDNAVVTQWNPPSPAGEGKDASPGTFVDFFVKLYVASEGPRSVNQ